MATAPTTANLIVPVTGDPSGDKTTKISWSITSPLMAAFLQTLPVGFTNVAVPSGSTLAIIIPPTSNTQSIIIKGITGDTGMALSPALPTVLSLASSMVNIGLTLGAGTSQIFEFAFI